MQTILPTANNIFCKPEEAVTKTESGFLLSEATAEKPKVATVINLGSGVKNVHQNDKIVYKSYSTSEVKLNGDEYFLIAEDDVLGVILEVKDGQ